MTDQLKARVQRIRDALDSLMTLEARDRLMPIGREWDAARAARADCDALLAALQQEAQRAPTPAEPSAQTALRELVDCHFTTLEHPDPEEEARRSHARMAAAWRQALKVLGIWPHRADMEPAAPATASAPQALTDEEILEVQREWTSNNVHTGMRGFARAILSRAQSKSDEIRRQAFQAGVEWERRMRSKSDEIRIDQLEEEAKIAAAELGFTHGSRDWENFVENYVASKANEGS